MSPIDDAAGDVYCTLKPLAYEAKTDVNEPSVPVPKFRIWAFAADGLYMVTVGAANMG